MATALSDDSSLLLRHQYRQGQPLRHWRVVVICPSSKLGFEDATTIQQQVAGTALASEMADVIAAILLSRFNGRSIIDICAMGGITVDDFTSSMAYREI